MRDEDLLVHFRDVKCNGQDSSGFNFFDFLHAHGSPLDALFYSRLFWPEFVEIDGMVFLKETIEDGDDKIRLGKTLKRYEGDKTKTEQSFNITEIPSLFGKKLAETTDEEDLVLAERLAEMWQHRLRVIYPNRKFIVQALSTEETGGEVGVNFYTERD